MYGHRIRDDLDEEAVASFGFARGARYVFSATRAAGFLPPAVNPRSGLPHAPARPPESRIEHVAHGVAEHVEPEHRERDRRAGPDRHPRRGVEERPPRPREHRAP